MPTRLLLERSGLSRPATEGHRRGGAGGQSGAHHGQRGHGHGHRTHPHIPAARWVLSSPLTPDSALHVAPPPLSLHPALLPQACADLAFVESWSKYLLVRHARRTPSAVASRTVNEPIRYDDIRVVERLFLHSNITSEMRFTRNLLALHLQSPRTLLPYPQPSPPPPPTSTSPTPCWRNTPPSCPPLSTSCSPPRPPT